MTTAILFIFIALLGVFSLKAFLSSSNRDSSASEEAESSSDSGKSSKGKKKSAVNLTLLQSQGVKSIQEARLHQLPAPPEPYVGRKKERKHLATAEQARPIILNIYGPQGIGKNALAFKMAEKLFFQHRDAQIYFDMKGNASEPKNVAEALAHVIQLFDPSADIPENKLELVKMYRNTTKNQRMVFVLDNISSSKQAKPLLLQKNSAMILISEEALEDIPGVVCQNLEVMDKHDTLELIDLHCPRTGFSNIELAKTCRNHPFSMVLSSRFMTANPDIEPPDFIKALHRQISSLEITGEIGFEKIQIAILNTCYSFLEPTMASALKKIAIIPGSFDAKAQSFICEDPENKYLANLHRMGFLVYEEKSDRYSMPEQIRHFLKKQTQVGEKSLTTTRLSTYYLTRLVSAHESFITGGQGIIKGMMIFDQEWDNISYGQSLAAMHANQTEDSARICSSYMESASELLKKRQPLSVAISWYESALHSAQKLGDTQAEKVHLIHLAAQLNTQKKHQKAEKLLEKCLHLSKEQGDAKTELAVLHQLGLSAMDAENYEKAMEHFNNERDYIEAIEDKPGLEEILEKLGECNQLMGESEEALKLYGIGLAQAQKAKNFVVQSRIFRKMGQTHNANKNGETAISFLEQGLILARKNKNKLEQGLILSELGESYDQSKNLDKAVGNYQQAVLMAQQANNMLMEGETTWKLCILLKQKGESSNAIRQGKSALKIFGALKHPLRQEVHKKVQEWRLSEGEVI